MGGLGFKKQSFYKVSGGIGLKKLRFYKVIDSLGLKKLSVLIRFGEAMPPRAKFKGLLLCFRRERLLI